MTMTNKKIDVPTSAADDNQNQSISSADQKGSVISAQPVVDSGADCGVGSWSGDGPDVKFNKA
jgi:hypothetical protein